MIENDTWNYFLPSPFCLPETALRALPVWMTTTDWHKRKHSARPWNAVMLKKNLLEGPFHCHLSQALITLIPQDASQEGNLHSRRYTSPDIHPTATILCPKMFGDVSRIFSMINTVSIRGFGIHGASLTFFPNTVFQNNCAWYLGINYSQRAELMVEVLLSILNT